MKVFECDSCGHLVFFENVQCLRCGHTLGFVPDAMDLAALEPAADGLWRALTPRARRAHYRQCANATDYGVCNWVVDATDSEPLCLVCRLNDTVPDLSIPANRERWAKLELAKHYAVYTLLRLGLPLDADQATPVGLRFKFLADEADGKPVLTGHDNGLITMNIAEADDPERERRRVSLHEPYRTLLGHFRHEVGHYYWDRLIANSQFLGAFRELFGDEAQDYGEALKKHYAHGAPPNWQTRWVSAYATTHPWEDWAETWAHYLHIIDTIETASSFGMTLRPRHPAARTMTFDSKQVVGTAADFDKIIGNWIPLTHALNCINRSMGLPDLYPFLLSNPAVEKLRFVHQVVQQATARG